MNAYLYLIPLPETSSAGDTHAKIISIDYYRDKINFELGTVSSDVFTKRLSAVCPIKEGLVGEVGALTYAEQVSAVLASLDGHIGGSAE